MNLDNIITQLRQFVRQRFSVPETDADFTDDVHLFDYGYVDSFGAVDLNAYVESEFGIKINQSDLIAHPLNSIREISTFVVKRRNGEV